MEIVNELDIQPDKNEGVICVLTCVSNDKNYIFYKNCNYKKGIKLMINALKGNRFNDRNKELQKDFLKYGEENFKVVILETVENDIKKYSALRKRYIKMYDSIDNGYNKKENCFLTENQRKLSDKNRKKKNRKAERRKEIEEAGGYGKWYYMKNKEKNKGKQKEYYLKNKQSYKKYYEKNRKHYREKAKEFYKRWKGKAKMYDALEQKLGKKVIKSILEDEKNN